MLIRKFARTYFIDLMSLFSRPKNGVYILNGHFISPCQSYDNSDFYSQLKKLRNAYDFLNIEDAVELVKESSPGSIDGRYISFTFDDGFKDCIESIAPTLNNFGVNACFFLNSAFIDSSEDYIDDFTSRKVKTPGKQPMSWSDVKQLDREGFVIGNHSKDHLRLSSLNSDDFYHQVIESHNTIEGFLGKGCEYFAWPYGQISDIRVDQVEALEKLYKYIFSGAEYKNYFSFDGRVYNRRHFEPDWPARHVKYFLSHGRV